VEQLIDLLSPIVLFVMGADSQKRSREQFDRLDVAPFLQSFESRFRSLGLEPDGDTYVLGDAVMVYGAQLLGEGSETAAEEIESAGATVDRTEQLSSQVVGLAAHAADRSLRARVVVTRGWAFLVSAEDEKDADRLVGFLDEHLQDELGSFDR